MQANRTMIEVAIDSAANHSPISEEQAEEARRELAQVKEAVRVLTNRPPSRENIADYDEWFIRYAAWSNATHAARATLCDLGILEGE